MRKLFTVIKNSSIVGSLDCPLIAEFFSQLD